MKIILSILSIVLTFMIIIKILDDRRLSEILSNIIGANNVQYISMLDDENIGFIDFRETYIFEIENIEKVSCNSLGYTEKERIDISIYDDFTKQYLDINEKYCSYSFGDLSTRLINIFIQDKTLILRVYTD